MPKTGPFDQHSDAYDEWFEKNRESYEVELKAVRQLIPFNGKGVEVGVGSGKFAGPLGIRTGVEPSEKMAAKARDQGIRVFLGVAEALPFRDSRFDFVLMVTTLCFLDDIPTSLREAFRVLKPGGDIIIGFIDKESELGKQYSEKRGGSRFYSEARFLSTQEVVAYLKGAGFETTKIIQALVPGKTQSVMDGFGSGAFIAIKGEKKLL